MSADSYFDDENLHGRESWKGFQYTFVTEWQKQETGDHYEGLVWPTSVSGQKSWHYSYTNTNLKMEGKSWMEEQ